MPHILLWALSLCHILCCGHCHCMATVGVMLPSYLLYGHSGCCCTVLRHGQGCCMAAVGVITLCCIAVGVVVWPQWVSSHHVVSQLGLLHGCVLCCGHCYCVAVVGVVLPLCLLHGCGGCRCAMLCHSQGCCVVVVGVIVPCCVVVEVVVWLWWVSLRRMGPW